MDKLTVLLEHSKQSLVLGKELISYTGITDTYHYDMIASLFLSKQVQHMSSILSLEGNRDVLLIARSMQEGLMQMINFVRGDKEKLAEQWRAYVFVGDWRRLQRRIKKGESIPTEKIKEIERHLEPYKELFYSKSALKAIENKSPLPEDPYTYKWINQTVTDVFKNIGDDNISQSFSEEMYYAYNLFSEWHHWDVNAMARAIMRDGETGEITGYRTISEGEFELALRVAVLCLLETMGSVDDYFQAGFQSKVVSIRKSFLQAMSQFNQ